MAEPKLAENLLHFVRLLRAAGLPLGPGSALDALRAAQAIDLTRRDELYFALMATLVHRREERELFDLAFRLFFCRPARAAPDEVLAELLARRPSPTALPRRLAEALPQPPRPGPVSAERRADILPSYAADEVLRRKDFAQMSAAELAEVRRRLASMRLVVEEVPTRRLRPALHGPRVDLRRTLRASLRLYGDAVPLRFRTPARRPPPLCALCDISGSMDRYSGLLLHFLHALTSARQRVFSFVFGTRLSHITRTLRHHDVDLALSRLRQAVTDWSGGTRIRECLHEFNLRWSRRVLSQGAIVLLITDGLDQDPQEGLSAEAERLHKSCRRLIWLNPLLRYEGFAPRARGIRALLPHVDEFRPVHNLDSLAALLDALSRPGTGAGAASARQ
jgi:hypothetical protein